MISTIICSLWIPALVALLTSAAVIALVIRSRVARLAMDHPNQRSLHQTPTPRLGGLGIVAGIAAGWVCLFPPFEWPVVLGVGILAAVSLLDDVRTLSAGWRLLLHIAVALLAMTVLLHAAHGIWLTLAATLATAWMINLYNFMDGSDGLAGGMACLGFGAYGVAALIAGDTTLASAGFVIAGATLGFLWFNFPPARIFMGDAGAIPLGYLAAVMGIAGWLRDAWPLWFGAIVFSPFIVDATVTLSRRAARGAKVWQAHREHYYQRLVRSGWSHRRTAVAEYALMLACSVLAIAAVRIEALRPVLLAGVPAIYITLLVMVERRVAVLPTQDATSGPC